jgi:hypothetical protein
MPLSFWDFDKPPLSSYVRLTRAHLLPDLTTVVICAGSDGSCSFSLVRSSSCLGRFSNYQRPRPLSPASKPMILASVGVLETTDPPELPQTQTLQRVFLAFLLLLTAMGLCVKALLLLSFVLFESLKDSSASALLAGSLHPRRCYPS